MKKIYLVAIFILIRVTTSFAGEADVLDVNVTKSATGSYSFSVTVAHEDAGWDHYVNRWDIVDNNGNVLGTRVLYHPHVHEQPFSRSLSGVVVPANIKSVSVRAHDSVHEYGGRTKTVELAQ